MRSFIDWFQFAHPEEFADDERAAQEAAKNGQSPLTVGVKARYEKYRKHIIAKQVSLFDHPGGKCCLRASCLDGHHVPLPC